MEPFTLLIVMASLLFASIFLVLIYVWFGRTKSASIAEIPATFESLSAIVNSTASTNKEINHAVTVLVEKFIHIGEGTRDYPHYEAMIEKLCFHPNTDSKVILRFEKALREANPKFKEKIEKALKHGLSKRGKK
jgi:hypothetical protein